MTPLIHNFVLSFCMPKPNYYRLSITTYKDYLISMNLSFKVLKNSTSMMSKFMIKNVDFMKISIIFMFVSSKLTEK